MAAPASAPSDAPPVPVKAIGGVVVEVDDLAAARAFYSRVLGDASGGWEGDDRSLTFAAPSQRITFVPKTRPQTFDDAGRHIGFRVATARVTALTDQLKAAGHEVSWWREDHPEEKRISPYVRDPSGNLVQLVGADRFDDPIHHVTLIVHDLELGEFLYADALSGAVDYYHSWRTEDLLEAKVWMDGDDPCAPWTRAARYGRLNHQVSARPIPQIFVRYGGSLLGLVVGSKHIQEPPEGVLKGTPRLVLRTDQSADEARSRLASRDVSTGLVPHNVVGVQSRKERATLFTRDRSGNFLELECAE
jgi:catechol 2,3-dioxygenase-like lactoylglutathione lyase family enzyme